jgi:hypothetical protein
MTATLTATARNRPGPPPWLVEADPRDGIRVRVDGATTLHTGQLAEPSYRVDVVTEDCLVELACGPALLRFACRTGLDAPAAGWSVAAPGPDTRSSLPVRVRQVVWACAGDREAIAAVAEISEWVADEAALRGSGRPPGEARRWRVGAERLRSQLETAQALRRVPTRPLRDEFLRQCARGELSAMEVGRRLGWFWPAASRRPDSARVLRRLGLIAQSSDRRDAAARLRRDPQLEQLAAQVAELTASLTYPVAVALCRALGCDPSDFGCL